MKANIPLNLNWEYHSCASSLCLEEALSLFTLLPAQSPNCRTNFSKVSIDGSNIICCHNRSAYKLLLALTSNSEPAEKFLTSAHRRRHLSINFKHCLAEARAQAWDGRKLSSIIVTSFPSAVRKHTTHHNKAQSLL